MCNLLAQLGVILNLHLDRICHLGDQVVGILFFHGPGKVEKSHLTQVMPQCPVLEKDMHRLPKRVVQGLDHLLMNEYIFGDRL